MTNRQHAALIRGVRTLCHAVIATCITLLAENQELISNGELIAPVLTAVLMSIDKALRYTP